ncbi:MAG: Trk system potassium transporter TrkA [Alphaproteobacteria bacterium]|nr:Trk system potassium transporter TrkA [Rhodobiaceae bacterium]MBO6542082.1 Trk system potassium transporter TrkA [Alphaproteobacteria bacterium]MBO6629734.1 Trk system potassium transporter TrkA [Alphaproteobacteria bacterium]MDF1625060.1 Trk system potassium transporter TrkA [Parvibaculaceae bacterium]
MKVIVCGAGQVGFGIARQLAAENNDVTVIDQSPQLVQRVSDVLDVRAIVGHGAHPDVLERAGAPDADMLIAVTFHDEVNMVACQVAHSVFNVPTKIARIRSQSYLQPGFQDLFARDHMPIDVIISPELEVGRAVLRRLAVPGAFDILEFADGLVNVVGVSVEEDCPIANTPLRQLTELFPDLKSRVVGVVRQGKLFVPHSDDQMIVGDQVYFASDRKEVRRTLGIFGHEEQQARRVLIVGAGNIGLYVAQELEKKNTGVRVKVLERSRDRAVFAADRLQRTIVLNGDGLEPEILREAGVQETETIVTLTNDDQANILTCVLAKREGCSRALSLINNQTYSPLMRSLGIDAFLNPRATTVSHILRHVRRGRIRGLQAVHDGAAEVIEAEALETSPLVGQPLREVDLPDGLIVGAIARDGNVITPNGSTIIEAGDKVVMFAQRDQVATVEQLFRVSLEFF